MDYGVTLRVYMACKPEASQLPTDRRIPDHVRLVTPETRRTVDIPVEIVEMPHPELNMVDPEDVVRPVPGGVSISAVGFVGAGTLGAWALDTTDDTVVFLSNAHVLGPTIGAEVYQPGVSDGGTPGVDRIGSVKRTTSFTAASDPPTPDDCHLVDAAIGAADDPDLIDLTVLDVGPAIYAIDAAAVGDAVVKFGQTTHHTTGRVIDIDLNTIFDIPTGPGAPSIPVVFCDLILIENTDGPPGFVSLGDSGSVVFRPDPDSIIEPAVGLGFAQMGPSGVACKIHNVFDAMDLDVLCASGYPAYLDGMAAGQSEDIRAPRFTGGERAKRATRRSRYGLARSVERQISSSSEGKKMIEFLSRHRHDLLMQIIRPGDLRRLATAALEPVLTGALTSSDVLSYRLDKEDVKRIERVGAELRRQGMDAVYDDFRKLALTDPSVEGKSVADVLGLS